jgi:hypothetical protein
VDTRGRARAAVTVGSRCGYGRLRAPNSEEFFKPRGIIYLTEPAKSGVITDLMAAFTPMITLIFSGVSDLLINILLQNILLQASRPMKRTDIREAEHDCVVLSVGDTTEEEL